MENRAHALAAGVFTLLLALALVASVWWLSGNREATRDVMLEARGSISGLNTQAQVRFRGLRVGKVQDISIDSRPPYRILVTIRIARTVPVTSRTTAQLNSQGVTGLSFVQLDDDGGGIPLASAADGLPHVELRPSPTDALGGAAADLASQLKELTRRLNQVLDEENLARLRRTLKHAEGASAGLEQTLRETPKVVADLRRLVNDDNVRRLSAVLANLEKASGEAPALAAEGRQAIAGLEKAAARLDALGADLGGEVNQSTLPRLNRLLGDLSASSRQLSRVLDQVERSPQSLLLGRPGLAPGPGEAGFKGEK